MFGGLTAAGEAGCSPAEPSGPRKEKQAKTRGHISKIKLKTQVIIHSLDVYAYL